MAVLVLSADLLLFTALLSWLRRPRNRYARWGAIIVLGLLALPVSGLKLLASSPDTAASSPGEVIIRNPEHRFATLYYLRNHPRGTRQVKWWENLLMTDQKNTLEMEGNYGQKVAYQQNGQWYYAPISNQLRDPIDLTFPRDFTAADTAGRIAAAVAADRGYELGSVLSNLLTLAHLMLIAALVLRQVSLRPHPREAC